MWQHNGSERTGEIATELDSPVKKEPVGQFAEVGGECFFSSVYYILVGRKSRKTKKHNDVNTCHNEKKTNIELLQERHNTSEGKKCRAIRTRAMEVARTIEFKRWSRKDLGTAMSDFMAYECAKATTAINEHAVGVINS